MIVIEKDNGLEWKLEFYSKGKLIDTIDLEKGCRGMKLPDHILNMYVIRDGLPTNTFTVKDRILDAFNLFQP